jgi:exopolyphosphatase/guanosine-5'-triphosphate,3'-diphosphate pyrophosphatase
VTRQRIKRLAAILRVADGFDRGHVGAVQKIKARWLDRALRLTVVPNPRARSIRLELWGANRKSAMLSKLIGTPIEIVAPDGTVVED